MKTLLVLLLALCAASAQTNTNTVTLRALPRSTETGWNSRLWSAYVDFAFVSGVRQWGNEVVDLRPARATFEAGKNLAQGFYLLAGKILSVTDDGVLLSLDEKVGYVDRTVFLYRAPFKSRSVDGEALAAFGKPMPPYSYTSALGARRTVKAYDCGEAPEKKWVDALNAQAAAEALQAEVARKEFAEKHNAAVQSDKAKRLAEADARTVAFYGQRAAAGDALAQYELALRHLSGKGVEKDDAEARKLLERAAKQGHAKAAEKLKSLP